MNKNKKQQQKKNIIDIYLPLKDHGNVRARQQGDFYISYTRPNTLLHSVY